MPNLIYLKNVSFEKSIFSTSNSSIFRFEISDKDLSKNIKTQWGFVNFYYKNNKKK